MIDRTQEDIVQDQRIDNERQLGIARDRRITELEQKLRDANEKIRLLEMESGKHDAVIKILNPLAPLVAHVENLVNQIKRKPK